MKPLWLAVSFLTRLPTPGVNAPTDRELAASSGYFVLVGPLVGGVMLMGLSIGSWGVSPLVGAILAVAAGEWFTRGFHLDGLSDCIDGLLVNGNAERRFAAMKDPHVGGLGAAATALWLMLRVAVVLALVDAANVGVALLLGATLSRGLLPLDLWLHAAASPSGLYATLKRELRGSDVAFGLVTIGIVVVPLLREAVFPTLAALGGCLLLPLVWHRALSTRLGGINGDVLGGAVQLREVWVWLCFS